MPLKVPRNGYRLPLLYGCKHAQERWPVPCKAQHHRLIDVLYRGQNQPGSRHETIMRSLPLLGEARKAERGKTEVVRPRPNHSDVAASKSTFQP